LFPYYALEGTGEKPETHRSNIFRLYLAAARQCISKYALFHRVKTIENSITIYTPA
jgi:hypothetical protein